MSASHEAETLAADEQWQVTTAQAEDHRAEERRRLPFGLVLGLAGTIAIAGCGANSTPEVPAVTPGATAAANPFEGPTLPATAAETPQPTETPEATTAGRRRAIVKTALSYVWGVGDDGKRKTGYKNNYAQKARAYTGMTATELQEPNNVMPETDCGLFVSSVMHQSGADPNYPKRETNIQKAYLEANADPANPQRIYDKLHVDSVDDLKAGDIAIYSRTIKEYRDAAGTHIPAKDTKRGHTYLVIKSAGADGVYDNHQGAINGSDDNPAASASWKDHGPQAVDIYLTYDDYGPKPFDFYRLR